MKDKTKRGDLVRDIAKVINKHSVENSCDTPDFMLAEYLVQCLAVFSGITNQRDSWHEAGSIKNTSTEDLYAEAAKKRGW